MKNKEENKKNIINRLNEMSIFKYIKKTSINETTMINTPKTNNNFLLIL